MGDWALGSGIQAQSFFSTGAAYYGFTVTSSATANTKGAYTQLVASTNFDASGLILVIDPQFEDTHYLIDVAVGAAGSESVILSNYYSAGSLAVTTVPLLLPLSIPAGTRISARSQDNFGSSASFVSGMVLGSGFFADSAWSSIDTYGAATGTSTGTSVNAGATANTKGAWTQLVASTTRAHKGLMVAVGRTNASTAAAADYGCSIDVGVGASGSEQVIIPDLVHAVTTAKKNAGHNVTFPIPCDLPAGSRLAARMQSSTTNTTDRVLDVAVYGFG